MQEVRRPRGAKAATAEVPKPGEGLKPAGRVAVGKVG